MNWLPAAVVLVAGCVLVLLDGGYRPEIWYPATLGLAVLLLATRLRRPLDPRADRPLRIALAAYAAFCAWSFASIAWAAAPGDALDGANRSLMYALALAIVASIATSPRAIAGLLWLVALSASAMALVLLALTAILEDPGRLFVFERLAEPTGYPNATAGYLGIAFWPAAHLAASRSIAWPARAVALTCACLLLQVGVLSQSRGSLAALAVAALVYLLLVPDRAPALVVLVGSVGAVVTAWSPLTAVRLNVGDAERLHAALADARMAIAVTCVGALIVGAAVARLQALGTFERRIVPRHANRRRAMVATGCVAVAIALSAGLVAGQPSDWVADRWRDFSSGGYAQVETGSSRFGGSLASNRYDFYRVALDEFRERPLTGIGSDNFVAPYLVARRSEEAPRNPHSTAVQHLVQLGLVGALLFLLFLGAAAARLVRAVRTSDRALAGLRAGAAAGFAMWLAHGMIDFLWDFTGVALTAFGLLGLALAPAIAAPGSGTARGSRAWRIAIGVAGLLVVLELGAGAIGARLTAAGYAAVERAPRRSLERFAHATRWRRLSSEPALAEGIVARELGLDDIAARALRTALRREPTNWLAHFELALLGGERGRFDLAVRHAETAARLNPRLDVVGDLARIVRRRRRLDPAPFDARLRYDPARIDALVLQRLYPR
jgi:O-antigen ligase